MIDIHNHTKFSDGVFMPEEIVLNAINNGIDIVGISDHHKAFFMEQPYYRDFKTYIEEISYLKKKYKDEIKILSGIELNLNFLYDIDENRIPYEELQKLDYVLLERVEGLSPNELPAKYYVKFKDIGHIAKKIKAKIGLAHTDLLKLAKIYSGNKSIEYGMDYVINTMKEYNIFWELNVQRQYKYFDYIINNRNDKNVALLFEKIKKHKIELIAGSDSHDYIWDFNINRLKLANLVASRW